MHNTNVTLKIDLPGGLGRMRELVLYIAQKCATAPRFGGIKLNKILWKSDFDSFAYRGVPVTGRPYQRLRLGPAPKEMLPLHREMIAAGSIRVDAVDFGDCIVERRTVALRDPDLTSFTTEDLQFVDAAIRYYWNMTGVETSEESHGIAWSSRRDSDPMPYESALLSDRNPGPKQMRRLEQLIYDRGMVSE